MKQYMTRNSFPNDAVKLDVNNFGYLEKCVNQHMWIGTLKHIV